MPGAEHHHPDYEQTFTRIATILDVFAQGQLATDRTLREFIAHANERDAGNTDKLNGLIEFTRERDAETTAKMGLLIERQVETTDKLNRWIELTKERDAETTDKLNALMDLM